MIMNLILILSPCVSGLLIFKDIIIHICAGLMLWLLGVKLSRELSVHNSDKSGFLK